MLRDMKWSEQHIEDKAKITCEQTKVVSAL